jgi:EAL domain-containing protein (putative c-di-GMP-specific phosphodiesterase class I)
LTAEGIETKKSLEIVRELGCNEAQGYLLGRPMEARAAKLALQRGIMAAAR